MLHAASRLLALTFLATALSAQAGERVDVVLEITPTVQETIRSPSLGVPSSSTPLSGEQATPFLLHYSITTDAVAEPALPNQSRPFQTDSKTPWTDTWLGKPKPPGFGDRSWHTGGGGASLSWALARGPGLQGTETLQLRTGDGYDTMGIEPYSPSWLFYERTVLLTATPAPPTVLDSYSTGTLANWLSAHQGQVFHNAFEEAGIYGGGVVRDHILGDVVIKSVTAVPEPATWLLMGLGLSGMVAVKRGIRGRHAGALDIAAKA